MSDTREKVTRFCTKHALTAGVEELTGHFIAGGMWFMPDGRCSSMSLKDSHDTREAALRRAVQLADKKLASLRKQLREVEVRRTEFLSELLKGTES